MQQKKHCSCLFSDYLKILIFLVLKLKILFNLLERSQASLSAFPWFSLALLHLNSMSEIFKKWICNSQHTPYSRTEQKEKQKVQLKFNFIFSQHDIYDFQTALNLFNTFLQNCPFALWPLHHISKAIIVAYILQLACKNYHLSYYSYSCQGC